MPSQLSGSTGVSHVNRSTRPPFPPYPYESSCPLVLLSSCTDCTFDRKQPLAPLLFDPRSDRLVSDTRHATGSLGSGLTEQSEGAALGRGIVIIVRRGRHSVTILGPKIAVARAGAIQGHYVVAYACGVDVMQDKVTARTRPWRGLKREGEGGGEVKTGRQTGKAETDLEIGPPVADTLR